MNKEKSRKASVQKRLMNEKKGIFSKYKDFYLGKVSFWYFIKYELIFLFLSWMPGALGLFLRKIFYPMLIKEVGKGVVFGKNMMIRHPKKIKIGNNVVLDDNVVLDAKGDENNGIIIGNNVLIGRNTLLSCKQGDIKINDFTNIGPNCYLVSETSLNLGKYVFVAGNSFMVAGGNHSYEDKKTPMMFQPSISKGGINIEDDVWIAASVNIIDGVKIGKGSIIGAASLVNKKIPAFSIAVGVPAKVIKER